MSQRRDYDPFAPHDEEEPAVAPFPEDRYRRAGATGEEIDLYRASWDRLAEADRIVWADRIAGVSDDDITRLLDQARAEERPGIAGPYSLADFDVSAATIAEVEAYVGTDPERARRVLTVESTDRARKGLIPTLEQIAGADALSGTESDADGPAGPDTPETPPEGAGDADSGPPADPSD
jgi:hypothetical protein